MFERLGPDLVRVDGEFYRRLDLKGKVADVAEFQGELYVLYDGRAYYAPIGKGAAQREELHREIWKATHGPIPDGHVIHHVDLDPLNNTIENFVCITHTEHRRLHGQPMEPERLRAHLARIQEKAAEWHRSDEGRAWHRVHGQRTWQNKKPRKVVCTECGKPFRTRAHGKVELCSTRCRNAVAARNPDNYVDRVCPCGATFKAWKWHRQKYCGRSCAGRANAARRGSGPQPDGG